MNPSRLFIARPVATSLLMVAVLLVGLVAYRQLPVSALPQVDYPTMQVVTFYPGAGPEVMASSVTAPLERQFGQLPGLTQMTSTSSDGSSVVTLQFSLDLNIDIAEQQVQAAINAANNFLPTDLPNPPIYSKTNPADAPVLTIALTSDSLPLTRVQDLADTRLAQKISQLPGVGLVSISGGQKPAVRVRVNPTKLAGLGLTMDEVRVAIGDSNSNGAKGNFDGPQQNVTIGANDQLLTADAYRQVVIAYRNNAAVRLSDVAEVTEDAENVRQAAWANGKPAVIVNVQRQPGANTIAVVDGILARLPALRETMPPAMKIDVLTDRTTTIRASVNDVQHELVLAIGLVVLVIFLFLRNVSAALIPGVAVPLSIIGTFAFMYLLGYSLNNLSLMALTISTGFVVDDAIVMIENIIRYMEKGDSPLEAALKGSGEIGFTIVSLSVSLIAALIPLLFMGDVVGRLFREFAVTLSVTIVVSAIVSLTLTPMTCALMLRHKAESEHGRLYRLTERGWEALIHAYERTLRVVLRHQPLTLLVAVATLGLTVVLFVFVPKGFFPVQDTGVILGISEAPQDTSFESMRRRQAALGEAVMQDPAVESLSSFIGIDGTNTTVNSGRIQINLKPIEQRKMAATDVIRRLQSKLHDMQGITLYMQPVQDLTVEDRVSRTQFQYTLESADNDDLDEWTPKFIEALRKRPELADVASDQQSAGPHVRVVIDRDAAGRLGVTPRQIDDALYNAFGQRQISTMFTQLNQYHVVLEADVPFQKRPQNLGDIYLTAASGQSIPLASVARIEQTTAPLSISRQGQFPVVTISFNLAAGTSLGTALEAVDEARASLGMPASITPRFQGTAQAFRTSLASQPLLILAALVTVYIVLGILYESFIHPITILSTLPSAGVGALLALMLCRTDFTVIALIGIILLIGIVKKNAIMMIDFALEAQRNQGLPPAEAVFQACLLRFRPILMTTMAALLGGVPLAIGGGVGSELRRPLGIAIVGGLIFSQVLTLYTTPVIYLFFDKLASKLRTKPSEYNTAVAGRKEPA